MCAGGNEYSHGSICGFLGKMGLHFCGDREGALSPALICSGLSNSWSCGQLCLPPALFLCHSCSGLQLQPVGDGCSDLTDRNNSQLTSSHQEVITLMGERVCSCHHPRQGEPALHLCAFLDRYHLQLHCLMLGYGWAGLQGCTGEYQGCQDIKNN